MPWRGRLFGDLLWKLNMVVCGEDGVLIRSLGLSELGCGNSLGGSGGNSLDLFDLRWVLGLTIIFW